MEMVKSEGGMANPLSGSNVLGALGQVWRLGAVAIAIALGIVVGLWTYKPTYETLYGSMGDREVAEIVEVLQKNGVDYKIQDRSGAIMVPAGKLREIRLQLAAEGLPKSSGSGFEMLQQKQEFGTSEFRELARYQHALESELVRSIMTIAAIESARVHLALPKQSVFLRKRQQPSASVLVNLYAGRNLDAGQVTAITHLVASSVPNLEASRVTVVDERGELLSRKQNDSSMGMSSDQFDYTRRIEQNYAERVEDLLAPIVGLTGVRAQVNADIDFTVTEQTQESYNPDMPATRSEQLFIENSTQGLAEGIPGALSNEPPVEATVPEDATGMAGQASGAPANSRRRSTVNYELDRTISHSRFATGTLKRLSVAVVLDDKIALNEAGETTRTARSEEEIVRITALIRDAVGFSVQRGDTINVINASFTPAEQSVALPEAPVWEQAWVMDAAKLLLGTVVVLLLIFMVLRPTFRNLATAMPQAALPAGGQNAGGLGGMAEDQLTLNQEESIKLPQPGAYEENIRMVQKAAQEDPKLVAQVVKNWISAD